MTDTISDFMPDYANRTTYASGASAPNKGWAFAYGVNGNVEMKVNDVQVAQCNYYAGKWSGNWNMQVMVDKGDVVTGATWYFHPFKNTTEAIRCIKY